MMEITTRHTYIRTYAFVRSRTRCALPLPSSKCFKKLNERRFVIYNNNTLHFTLPRDARRPVKTRVTSIHSNTRVMMLTAAARFGRFATTTTTTTRTTSLSATKRVILVAARQTTGGRSSSSAASGGRGRGRGGGRRPSSGDTASVPRQRRNFDDAQRAALEANGDARGGGFARVVVGRGKANMFLDGNPIVYAGAIERIEGEVKNGDYVCVTDHAMSPIALGFYNDTSSYSVRI